MNVSFAKFSNDIVSLAVMALMTVAFIAAQAGLTESIAPGAERVGEVEIEQVLVIDMDLSLRGIGE